MFLFQGKTRKNLKFVRAAGPLTAVVVGTLFVWIFNPADITLVGDILILCNSQCCLKAIDDDHIET